MRGKQSPKRKIEGDIKHNNLTIAKFINYIMRNGKKSVAQKIVYDAFDIIKEKTKADPFEIFNKAIRNVSPIMEVKGKRIGGANYQIPIQVRSERRFILASRWMIEAAKERKGQAMAQKLASEIIDASNQTGPAVRKKENVHKMAEANRAFAHFAR